jgi:hypothetical protein
MFLYLFLGSSLPHSLYFSFPSLLSGSYSDSLFHSLFLSLCLILLSFIAFFLFVFLSLSDWFPFPYSISHTLTPAQTQTLSSSFLIPFKSSPQSLQLVFVLQPREAFLGGLLLNEELDQVVEPRVLRKLTPKMRRKIWRRIVLDGLSRQIWRGIILEGLNVRVGWRRRPLGGHPPADGGKHKSPVKKFGLVFCCVSFIVMIFSVKFGFIVSCFVKFIVVMFSVEFALVSYWIKCSVLASVECFSNYYVFSLNLC